MIREYKLLQMKQYRHNLKKEVLRHYGNGKAICIRCGFADIRALSIDHIDNNGKYHRKTVGGGTAIYRWFKNNNYPSGFQTLCYNCQIIKHREFTKAGIV